MSGTFLFFLRTAKNKKQEGEKKKWLVLRQHLEWEME
jgi:hypothetical protein